MGEKGTPLPVLAAGEVDILTVGGRLNAEPIVAALRANGIPARLVGEALGSVYGLTLDGLGEVRVVVPKPYAEAARELLARAEAGELHLGDQEPEPAAGDPAGT